MHTHTHTHTIVQYSTVQNSTEQYPPTHTYTYTNTHSRAHLQHPLSPAQIPAPTGVVHLVPDRGGGGVPILHTDKSRVLLNIIRGEGLYIFMEFETYFHICLWRYIDVEESTYLVECVTREIYIYIYVYIYTHMYI
jgi:hypothetical protein